MRYQILLSLMLGISSVYAQNRVDTIYVEGDTILIEITPPVDPPVAPEIPRYFFSSSSDNWSIFTIYDYTLADTLKFISGLPVGVVARWHLHNQAMELYEASWPIQWHTVPTVSSITSRTLFQSQPNTTPDSTVITFVVPFRYDNTTTHVTINLYKLGVAINSFEAEMEIGYHEFPIDMRDLPPGVYSCIINAGGEISVHSLRKR